jgi:hypothetical protein
MGLTWKGLCDEIFDRIQVNVRDEDLRQWVERFIARTRKSSRCPNKAELKAIASFLMHPDIDMLSEKELNEPEIPYRFAAFLLDFLAHPGHNQPFPPKKLGGRYRGFFRFSNGSISTRELTLEVRESEHVIHVSESEKICRSSVLTTSYEAHGWAIITPEDNLFIFMKSDRYARNHYYITIALSPGIWSDTSVREFTLLRHQYPVLRTSDSTTVWGMMRETDDDTGFLVFNKIAETEADR